MIPALPVEMPSDDQPPEKIQGYISVRGTRSVFGSRAMPKDLPASAEPYYAKKEDRDTTRQDLEKAGFEIVSESQLGFAVSAPPQAYEDLTGARIEMKERLMMAEENCIRYVTHIDLVGENQPRSMGVAAVRSEASKIDGVVIEKPKIVYDVFPAINPPTPARFYLRVPEDVATVLGARALHQLGIRGEGVEIVMPDSGQYRHPFFAARGYNVKTPIAMVPGTQPNADPVGHGTGESANIFAVAPGANLQPIRASNNNGDLVAAIAALMKAKELKPRIITNSWGGDVQYPPVFGPDEADLALALELKDAIDQGILVIFSAGNGQFSIEAQVPGVLSAGGVYLNPSMQLQASDYASGYDSPWYPGVRVPTACGLVGMQPRAQYLMLPVPPGSMLDVDESLPDFPDISTDGTTGNDGWALFSGTSAAAPQLAGVAALIIGIKPSIKPAQVIEAITSTCIDVTMGNCHPRFGNVAGPGPDRATGPGLVNAYWAAGYAWHRF